MELRGSLGSLAARSLLRVRDWEPPEKSTIPESLPEFARRERPSGSSLFGWLNGHQLNPALDATTASGLTRALAGRFVAETVRSIRQRNYRRLWNGLLDLPAIRSPLGDLPPGVCPWTFPIDIRGRAGFDRRLRLLGIPAFTYGDTLHANLLPGSLPDCEYLALNLVQIPVHQGLSLDDMDRIVDAIRRVVSKL